MKILYIQDSIDMDMWHSYITVGNYKHHIGTFHVDSLNFIMEELLGSNTSNLPDGDDRFTINFTKAEFEVV